MKIGKLSWSRFCLQIFFDEKEMYIALKVISPGASPAFDILLQEVENY